MQAALWFAMVGKSGGRTRGRRSVDLIVIPGQALHFFGISLLRKQGFSCLLRGFLAYIFGGLLINKQYVKRDLDFHNVYFVQKKD